VRGRGGDESGDFSPLPPLSPSPRLSAVDQRMLPRVQVPAWQGIGGLVHGFLGRHGGVSAGDCASLNLSASVEDASTALESNWDRVRREFPGIVMVTMRQVHGAQVVRVDQATTEIGPADGLITRACGVGLGVLTADCVPILMIAPRERIALAVHAGWRGTLAGIAHAAVGAAQHEFGIRATELLAALGPAIGGCCYEVEAHIGAELEDRWGRMPEAWRRHGDRGSLDLRQANLAILAAAGVSPGSIAAVGPCTACRPAEYFSHRGAGGRTGRQLSFVGWQ